MNLRRAGALLVLIANVAWFAADGPSARAATVSCLSPGKYLPILLVHGQNGEPEDFTEHGSDPLIAHLDEIHGAAVDNSFSYSSVASDWVTNPGIGQALADHIGCLAMKSKQGGGPGKVVVVAHSMGGLAVRQAASLTVSGTSQKVAQLIARIVTISTPNTGSWVDGVFHSVQAGSAGLDLATLTWLLQGVCGAADVGPCGDVEGATSPSGSAMVPRSSQLSALPAPPSGIPLDEVAGQLTVTVSLFGHGPYALFPSGALGDLLVKPDSALAYQSVQGDAGFTDACTMSVSQIAGNLMWTGCQHGGLLYNQAVSAQVVTWVEASIAKPPGPPVLNVTVCGTEGGASNTAATDAPATVSLPLDLEGLPPMTYYVDPASLVAVLAPSGWQCSAIDGESYTTSVEVGPPGHPPSLTDGITGGGISGYSTVACEGCLFDLGCQLLPSLAAPFSVGFPCQTSLRPPAVTRVDPNTVGFSYLPGTWPNNVGNTTDSQSGFVDLYGTPETGGNGSKEDCILPSSEAPLCNAAASAFLLNRGVPPWNQHGVAS